MKHCYALATPEFPDECSVFALSCDQHDYVGFSENAARIADAGYDGVDLVMVNPLAFDQDRVLAILHQHHLEVSAICTGELYAQEHLALSDPNPYRRRVAINRFNTISGFAAQLGAVVNIGRSRGDYVPGIEKTDTQRWAVDSFRAVSEYAGALGVNIALEPVCGKMMQFLNTADEVAEICKAVNLENFGYMLDTQHLSWEHDPIGVIEQYGKACLHVHLTDTERTCPGTGHIDFDVMIAAFAAAGYGGSFAHESFHMDETVQQAMNYMGPVFKKYYE